MNTSKKNVLYLALLAAISAVAVYSFSPGQVAAQSVDPQTLVSQPSEPHLQSDSAQQVDPVSLPLSPDAPVVVPATTHAITGSIVPPTTPEAVPSPSVSLQGASDPEIIRLQREAEQSAERIAQMTSSSADESAILREIARYQARLSLLNVVSKVETTQQQMATSRAKFEVEQTKTLGELNTAQTLLPTPGLPAQPGTPPNISLGEIDDVQEMPYTLVGLSSFGKRSIAQIAGPVGTQSVEVGSVIGDGYRVSRVSSDSVVLTYEGKRHTLYLSPLPSAGSSSGSLNSK